MRLISLILVSDKSSGQLIHWHTNVLMYGFNFYCSLLFFKAEDGIRDGTVTGVQTCALPIFCGHFGHVDGRVRGQLGGQFDRRVGCTRSEERRGGKECRSRWSPYH